MKQATTRSQPAEPALRTRILAVDYGRRRIGLAVSDELNLTARPLGTLARTNRRNDWRRLRELARQHGAGRIVVGLPLNLDGTRGPMADEAARFAERLGKELGLPVELTDERLSSWEAEETLRATASRGRRPARADDVAAAVILRDYLEKLAKRQERR
jgi:putative Holliday junction resolvase